MNLAVIFDVSVRGASILIRAIFTFFLARILSLEEFGIYTYISATSAFLIYVGSADFYAYAHREYLSGRISLESTLKAQTLFLGFSLAVAGVVGWLVAQDTLTDGLLLLLPLIIIGETLAAELVRVLIACGKPSTANVVNFLKSAGWMLPLMGYASLQDLPFAYICPMWAAGLLTATLFGIAHLPVSISQIRASMVPPAFFRKAWQCLPGILLGTLALRAIFSLDRLAVEWALGPAVVGIYGFFVAIASAYLALLDAGILARLSPQLITAAAQHGAHNGHGHAHRMRLWALAFGVAALLLYGIFIDDVVLLVGKPAFGESKEIGFILLAAYTVYAYSMGAHSVLYAWGKDKAIYGIHIAGLVPFAVCAACALQLQASWLVAVGVLAATALHAALKTWFAHRLRPVPA